MTEEYVYFDVLDTRRTALGGATDESRRANECIRLGQAEIKMSVLRGWIPVFPQTFGWDSAALLGFIGEDNREGPSFGWLLANGFIRIRLRSAASIWDAALTAFQNPAYRRLGAWPEFNTDDPLEARRPLVEAMRTGKCPAALPESVRDRLERLRRLSDAAAQSPPAGPELPRRDELRKLIERAARAAQNIDGTTAGFLELCTQVSDPNNRTAIDAFLDAQEQYGAVVPPAVRDITDCCLNAVMAKSVGAKRRALTTPRSTHAAAVQILLEALPGSHRIDLFEEPSGTQSSDALSGLEVVGWEKIRIFLKEMNGLSLPEKTRQAEVAKMIAQVVIEGTARYALRVGVVNFLGKAAVGTAGVLAGLAVAGPPGAAVAIIAGIAGGLADLDVRSVEKRQLTKVVEKKWLGGLQAQ